MQKYLLLLFLPFISLSGFTQDTVRRSVPGQSFRMTLDTNRVIYDEQGKPLRHYQYDPLLKSGQYGYRTIAGQDPRDPKAKLYLFKTNRTGSIGDTVRRSIVGRPFSMKLDTNRVIYDEQGNALHYYQYYKLLNSGDYTYRTKGAADPRDPNTKWYLKKLTDEEKAQRNSLLNAVMAVKSPVLQENMPLSLTPLLQTVSREELNNKAIVLVFWAADCPPCTESFAEINDLVKKLSHPEDVVLIAITPDQEAVANAKLIQKPLSYSQLITNGRSVINDYQLRTFPTLVVTDKSHVIRFASSGSSIATASAFKKALSQY